MDGDLRAGRPTEPRLRVRQASWVLLLCSILYNLLVLMTSESLDSASKLFPVLGQCKPDALGFGPRSTAKAAQGRRTPYTFLPAGVASSRLIGESGRDL